jgi:hypothetical protein
MESEAHREGDPVGDVAGCMIPHSSICRNASEPARNVTVQSLMRAFTLSLLCCLLSCGGGEGKYTFTLDGEGIEPEILHVYGELGRVVAGDMALVDEVTFVLDEPGVYSLESGPGFCLYRRLPDGGRREIAMSVGKGEIPSMTDREWRDVRAVKVLEWSADVVDGLRMLDAERCHIKVDVFADGLEVEKLPRDLGYFTPAGTFTERDEEALTRMTRLVYLSPDCSVECDSDTFASCHGPSCCNVSYLAEVDQLRTLYLSWTCVEDLSILGGHPNLRHLSASNTPLHTLPDEPLPALRHVRAMCTNLDDADVKRFAAQNPRCRAETSIVSELEERVEKAARLRVLGGSSCHPGREDPVLHEGYSRAEVDEILELLVVDEGFGGHFWIPGCGSVSVEFLDAQGRSLARIGVLQSGAVRCPSVWPTFAGLQPDARRPFGAWLGERGAGWLLGF